MGCIRTVVGLAVAALALASCASAPPSPGSSDDRGCINRHEINSITPLDDEHVLAKLSATRFQLFTVDQPCNGLRRARVVTISDATTRVCGDGTALISFNYPAVGPTRCRIRRVEPVADKAAALELIESRAGE
jgi:hypothetical protein